MREPDAPSKTSPALSRLDDRSGEATMTERTLSTEHRILVVMRKVLTSIIRETTPPPGLKHPLSDRTIEDIRQCLALISARERELEQNAGVQRQERPHFVDEPQTTKVIPLHSTGLTRKKKDEDP